MQLKTLKYFVVLAESRSINEAARRLYIAQPSLTKALQQMEQELGRELFFRNRAGIQLTEAGKQILPQARQMVAWYNEWLSCSEDRMPKSVDIYVHTSLSGFLLPEIILRFRNKYPSLKINYNMTMQAEDYVSYDPERPALAISICNQKANLLRKTQAWGNDPIPLFHGDYRCLVNVAGPLGDRDGITLKELKSYNLLLPDVRSLWDTPSEDALCDILYDLTENAFPGKDVCVTEVSNVISMLGCEKEAYVLAFYPACKRYNGVASGELRSIPFQDYYSGANLYLFYNSRTYHHYPVLQELVQSICDASEEFLKNHGDEALSLNPDLKKFRPGGW